jgi:hypothetical protein
MRQFRAEIDDSLYKEIQLSMAHLEAETNAELLRLLLEEAEYEN